MKVLIMLCTVLIPFAVHAEAVTAVNTVTSAVTASPGSGPTPVKPVVAGKDVVTATTATIPAAQTVTVPSGTPASSTGAAPVAVAAPSAPPQWAQDLIVTAEGLPVVGPFVAKGLLYLGIISAILTTLVGSALAILNTLMGIFNASGLTNLATAIASFRDGKIMYWITFFSMFNAKAPVANPPQTVQTA